MSIAVELSDLASTLTGYPWCYLITVGVSGEAHPLAVRPEFVDGRFSCDAGRGTRANASERPEVTLVFPPAVDGGHSLIIDGTAAVSASGVVVTPSSAVLHRPA